MSATGDPSERPTPRPAPRRTGRAAGAKVLFLVGVPALVVLAGTVALLTTPAARRADRAADQAVDALLAPAAPAGPRPVGDREIVFGMATALSGANRELGRDMKAGVETAFAEINAAGGVNGRTLRLVVLDDGYEPSRTLPAVKRLVEADGALAIVGDVGTPTAEVALPWCGANRVVFFGALSGGDALRKRPPDRYVFNYRPSYAEETAAAVRWLADARRIAPARIAVFAQQDAFGESGWRGAAEELAARGVDPGSVVRVGYRRNTDDVDEAVQTLRAQAGSIDAVVMVATYKAAAAFIRRVRGAGLRLLVTNVSAVDANALGEELAAAGPGSAEGVLVTQVVPLPGSKLPGVARFHDAMARHGQGERQGFLALEGWIVANVLAEGLRRAGRELDPDRLVQALEQIHGLDVGIGARIGFGPTEHQGSHKVWATLLQPDGSWRQVELR